MNASTSTRPLATTILMVWVPLVGQLRAQTRKRER
jgi:hypothetical protein